MVTDFKEKLCRRSFNRLIILIMACVLLFSLAASGRAESAPGEELLLTILHTNDEHGAFIPHSPTVDHHPERENPAVGGYARLAAAVGEIRREKEAGGEPVLLISAGDYLGESPYSWLIPRGFTAEMEVKHLIGYDAVVIGNHEYDYGSDILAEYLAGAGYPAAHEKTIVLASNTVAPPDHPLAADLYRESRVMVLENGLTVGLFGLIGKQAIAYTTANYPVTFTDQHETAARMVEELKSRGAELIIAITHSNEDEDRELARAVPGIDVIVGGHSHATLHEPIIEGETIILQAGSQLRYLGRLELAYDRSADTVEVRNPDQGLPYLIPLDYRIPLDPEVSVLIDSYTDELNAMLAAKTGGVINDVLDPVMAADFEIPTLYLQESPLGNFVADAMRLVTSEKTGQRVDFAIQANGAIRGSVSPGTTPHGLGMVSVYDLASTTGLGIGPDGEAGYSIVAAYLTGEEIRRALEVAVLLAEMMGDTFFLQFSGLRYDYNPRNAVLFNVPVLDMPLPSTRAVTGAERYTGEGRQGDDEARYAPINWGDEELYCLVTDSYIVSFLPMVGDMLPMLELTLKDSAGNPVPDDELDRLIVEVDGEELKVWAAVLEYAASQPIGSSGLPEVDSYYASAAGRINPVWTVPYTAWLILALLVLVLLTVLLVRRRRLRKKRLQG